MADALLPGVARPGAPPLLPFKRISGVPFVRRLWCTTIARRKIGVNSLGVKSSLFAHGIRCRFVPDPSAPTPSATSSGRGFFRRLLRWAVGILVLAAVVSAAILWLYNRAFTSEKPVTRASRFTSGNFAFPVQVAIFADHVTRYKPRFLGHTEESITLRQIASVKVMSGPVFADVVVDTTGGSPPVTIHGLWKKDAAALAAAIAAAQAALPMPVRPVPTPAPPATPPG